ncbi:MAG: DUF2314 domain-containing protein [Phycisphaerae bacterium]
MSHPRIIYLLPLLLLLLGCSKNDDTASTKNADVVKRQGQPDYTKTFDKKLMDRAIQKANDTLQDFITALQNPRPTMSSFAVKKQFPAEKGGEHIWLIDVSWDGKAFTATVDNDPVDTKAVKIGDRVQVTPDELSDWMFVENGSLHGGYTIRVLYYQASPEEQKEFRKHTSFSVPPIDF